MTRKLKALSLGLVAALAVSAVSAASASATTTGVLTAPEDVTLTGEDSGTNAFTAFSSEVTCPKAPTQGTRS